MSISWRTISVGTTTCIGYLDKIRMKDQSISNELRKEVWKRTLKVSESELESGQSLEVMMVSG